jgi:hypothetical protein
MEHINTLLGQLYGSLNIKARSYSCHYVLNDKWKKREFVSCELLSSHFVSSMNHVTEQSISLPTLQVGSVRMLDGHVQT